ncbi:hypothetical protein QQ054_04300 [Oscillatoria amoena NRMC-F 0135]|nr:hypothetical protein [Oscillatoria amoena NRMC-F 0135]
MINDLHADKSGREINLFDSVFNTIITINDTRAQLKLLFILLNKIYILRNSEFLFVVPSELNNYFNNRLTQITERIVNTASNCNVLSRKEKAEWMLGCAKMLATIDAGYWGVYILPYIKRAEGELKLQKSDSTLLDFTTSIRALYWSSLSDESAKEMAMRIMKQEFQLKKHRLSNFDCFRTFSFLAHIQLQKTVELKLELSPFLEREKLYAASYFITSSGFYNSSVNSNVEYKDCIIKLWVENYIGYHAMMENYSKTIPALYYLAGFQKESKRDDVKLDLPYKIYNLPLAYFNEGNRELANKWYQAWYDDTTLIAFKENDLPESIRLYNESQLEQLRVDVRNGYFPFRLDPIKERRYKAVHIAENSAKKGKWKDAYNFMAIADSMRPKAPTFDYMLIVCLECRRLLLSGANATQ